MDNIIASKPGKYSNFLIMDKDETGVLKDTLLDDKE